MMQRTFTADAEDGKAMTVGELRQFLEQITPASADSAVKVRISFGGGIKKITVTDP